MVHPGVLPRRVIEELEDVAGPHRVVTDPDLLIGSLVDWTGRWEGSSPMMLRPRLTSEVAGHLGVLNHHGVPVQFQGGNTGMVGGSVPMGGEVLVSLRDVAGIEEVDERSGQMVVAAGTTLAEVQQKALQSGWRYPVDLGARDTATIGGTVATNAGGVHVLRDGMTRAQVLGLEAVLADGRIMESLRGLDKDNTGYHLPSLFTGSEGTLGAITRVRLRLLPPHDEEAVAMLGFAGLDAAIEAVGQLRRHFDVQAIEIMLEDVLELVVDHLGVSLPLSRAWPVVLLVEAAGTAGVVDRLASVVHDGSDPDEVVVASDRAGRQRLWAHRDAHSVAISTLGVPTKLDVTVPQGRVAAFIGEVREAVVADGASQAWIFGHAGDGNLHVNLTGPEPAGLADHILHLAVDAGGSVSAEHGIGRDKVDWLGACRGPGELQVFRMVKDALDPAGRLNPGVLFG